MIIILHTSEQSDNQETFIWKNYVFPTSTSLVRETDGVLDYLKVKTHTNRMKDDQTYRFSSFIAISLDISYQINQQSLITFYL